ncbi:MAG: THUMP domain-containing class I SAM-dependent RNA methyltransferase [Dissulfurispiraceae bacterium]|jgi:23S rRNA G2445 N2-methylase RlmL
MEKTKLLITCPKGLPPYLAQELTMLGYPVIDETVAGIETEGSLDDTMQLNLSLRTAHRVLLHLKSFTAEDAADLYTKASEIEWERYIDKNEYLSVHSSVDNPTITNPLFANVKCKDAIVDRIKNKCGCRPDSGPEMTGAVVFLYWKGNRCSIYLDTSGEPLAKRGYRKIPLKAPMQETLAAAIVMAAGWKGSGNFINPMCGSGTIAIEAALIALNRTPGILRSNYGFMHIKGFDKDKWDELRTRTKAMGTKTLNGKIIATDNNPSAIRAARNNASTAGVEHLIEFAICDFKETRIPAGGGVVILNPEYGERLGKQTMLENTYREIGDFFKQKCKGYKGYIFTGNFDLIKKVGLRSKRKIPFFNSNIECRLLEYELYEGSMRVRSSNNLQT